MVGFFGAEKCFSCKMKLAVAVIPILFYVDFMNKGLKVSTVC